MAKMWNRVVRIWPRWIISPILVINRTLPFGYSHEIGEPAQSDRDIYNLLDRLPPHLQFTAEEEALGLAGLKALGIPSGVQFVCLIVRDSTYLEAKLPDGSWSYHNYRDCSIQNHVMAAEELVRRGYYVIRMGVAVAEPIITDESQIIDYACNGRRSDFMDVYLGAKCSFCISVGTGFDAIPKIFRRPTVFVNRVPVGYFCTFQTGNIGIFKHHHDVTTSRQLSLSNIFTKSVGFALRASDFEENSVQLIENSPEEIRDVVVEMAERLSGTWKSLKEDEALQKRFWEIFPIAAKSSSNGQPLHGAIRVRYGAAFLRNNSEWLR